MGNCCSALLDCNGASCSKWVSENLFELDDKPKKPIEEITPAEQNYPSPWPKLPQDLDNEEVLKVRRIDLNIFSNGFAHKTQKYDLMRDSDDPTLVTRRGQEFFIDVYFNRPFDKSSDAITLLFTIADGKPSFSNSTLVMVPLYSKKYPTKETTWSSFIQEIDEDSFKIQIGIRSPNNCTVGSWRIAIDTKLRGTYGSALSYSFKNPIYVIFNPWNEGDQVYMEDEGTREECVMEESGLIWRGSHNRLRPTPWAYSQFEKNVLECALYLLSGPGHLSPIARADPVKVARAISAAVNSPDNDGLLEGNWTEDFTGGIKPSKWTGSLKIMQEYYRTKKPVKFSQCWVFAGALTTICRALGIPCRPVTNYNSAHDTQASLTVDYFMDDDGKEVEELNTDSVWNFHVWNEVWMSRPDLDSGDKIYSGWQAVDATPQEKSDDMFRCGPAPVSAVRLGEILRPFDCGFLFSEVNADKVYWHYRGVSRPVKLLGKKQEAIGMSISTKANGSFEREDITDTYKYPEKSAEEREVMLNALKQSENQFSRFYLNEDFNDVRFDFELVDDIVIGEPFRVVLKVQNVHAENEYDIEVVLRVDAMLYTGKIKDQIKKDMYTMKILPESEEEITMTVTFDEYYPKLCDDQCSFNIVCLAKVVETNFEYIAQDGFRVRKPDIKFDIPSKDQIFANEPFTGTLLLTNPLPIELNRCQFTLDAPGFGDPIKILVDGSIGPGEVGTGEFTLIPRDSGEKTITAKFSSLELEDCDGFISILVQQPDIDNEI